MFIHRSSVFNYTVLQHVSALSGHRLVIHLYILIFTFLLFLPTVVNVLHMRETVYYYCPIVLYRLHSNYYYY
jgi:hypothetical protein